MTDVELNWTSAEVEDGKLTVELRGEASSDWQHSFEHTIALLPGGDWGKVRIKKDTVRVSDVVPGSEEKLRHHLESVVEQANAAVRPSQYESKQGKDEPSPDDPDARMAETFRAFAEHSDSETPAP